MANDNIYTDPTNNEMITEMQNAQDRQNAQDMRTGQNNSISEQMPPQTMQRPSPTPNPQDQDTFSEILTANIGAYVLIQFLIGSTSLVDKEGYLYAVGTNFITIYEPLDDRYVVCDLYSVKFVTIYNTPPIGNSQRTGSAMSYSGANASRYTRN